MTAVRYVEHALSQRSLRTEQNGRLTKTRARSKLRRNAPEGVQISRYGSPQSHRLEIYDSGSP